MRGFFKGLAIIAVLALALFCWAAWTPSERNTVALLAKHQTEITDFLAMAQAESGQFQDIYAGSGTGGQAMTNGERFWREPAPPEL